MTRQAYVLSAILVLALGGCVKGPATEIRDPMSAGTAKLFLDKQETTQAQVLEAFGGPNIVAGDADGNETWTYDRMAYAVNSKTGGGVTAGGGVIGSVPVGGLLWGSASKKSSSSRTMTLFLYWADGSLVDFKYRSASF